MPRAYDSFVRMMKRCAVWVVAVAMACGAMVSGAVAQSLPAGTVIPVLLQQTLEAGKTRVGAAVRARTMQVVEVAGEPAVPKGSWVVGRVVRSQALVAGGAPSVLAVRFDRLETKAGSAPLRVQLRALADTLTTQDAEVPFYLDTKDRQGTYHLIGGGVYLQWDKVVDLPGGAGQATVTRDGVFGRMTAETAGGQPCVATGEMESVWIYSPAACGLYGYRGLRVRQAGETMVLESRTATVKLEGEGSALLQVSSR